VINVLFAENATNELTLQAQDIYKKTLNIEKADKFLLMMRRYIKETLTYFPRLGRSAEEFGSGIRKLIYQGYSILYKIDGNTIYVITIYRENLPNL